MANVLEASKLNKFIPLPFQEQQTRTAEDIYGIDVPYDLLENIYNYYDGKTIE